ncbi:MAG: hypothetical protein CYG61_07480 [Actinobacteria bacterium]|nr:MAG: hypothetical protein CYG61_07480 [Actinomycetota bacterium]
MGAAGEESGSAATLPMRLLVVDARIGFTPLQFERWDEWLLVRSPPLLGALTTVFETVWDQALPLPFGGGEATTTQTTELSEDDQRVLVLLAAGLRDKGIARQLGVGIRTVERRVNKIMEVLGAQTRFQAALLASRRGWLSEDQGKRSPRAQTTWPLSSEPPSSGQRGQRGRPGGAGGRAMAASVSDARSNR